MISSVCNPDTDDPSLIITIMKLGFRDGDGRTLPAAVTLMLKCSDSLQKLFHVSLRQVQIMMKRSINSTALGRLEVRVDWRVTPKSLTQITKVRIHSESKCHQSFMVVEKL